MADKTYFMKGGVEPYFFELKTVLSIQAAERMKRLIRGIRGRTSVTRTDRIAARFSSAAAWPRMNPFMKMPVT
jgi:hypothetical protein